MIGLVLIQHGKGADMGAAFGSGSAGSLFGASGSANFLSRTTAVLAAVFFVCTLALAYFSMRGRRSGGSLLERAATGRAAPRRRTGCRPQIPAPAQRRHRPLHRACTGATGPGAAQIPAK